MILLIFLPPLLACILMMSKKYFQASYLSLIISFILLLIHKPPYVEALSWAPHISLNSTFLVDTLSYSFGLVILLVSTLILLFSTRFMRARHDIYLFYIGMTLLSVGMLGTVLSSNMVIFYIFWDVMFIVSYFLITEWGRPGAKEIGLKFFIYMAIAAVALLLGINLLHVYTGTYELLEMHNVHWVALLPIMAALLIKLGIFPVHDWIPDALSVAPIPVSAMIAGLMECVGGYALLRFSIVFKDAFTVFSYPLMALALLTLVFGSLMVFRQNNILRFFAWSTVAQAGLILFGVSTLALEGVQGTSLLLVAQAVTKSSIFLVVAILVYITHDYSLRKNRVGARFPLLVGLAAISLLSLAGIPGFAIFQAEWMIFLAGLKSPLMGAIAMFTSVLTLGYCLWFFSQVFMTEGPLNSRAGAKDSVINIMVKHIPKTLFIPLIVLCLIIIIMGIYPTPFMVIH